MEDQRKQHQYGDQQKHQFFGSGDDQPSKSVLPQNGPSASQIIAVVTLVPLGGTLLLLAGLTLAGTIIGLALATPLFLLFSPILVPAIVTIVLAVAGILTSGAFGITGLSFFSWLANYMRRTRLPQQAFRGVQDTTGQLTQKARGMGQTVTDKAQELGLAVTGKAQEVGQAGQGKAEEVGQNVKSKAQEAGHKAQEAGHKAQDTGRTHEGGRARDVKATVMT